MFPPTSILLDDSNTVVEHATETPVIIRASNA